MWSDRYGADVLSAPRKRELPAVTADPGVVVEDAETGWVGAVTRVEKSGGVHVVALEDRHGRSRSFPLGPGFLVDGKPVRLTAPVTGRAPAAPTRTASGSRAVVGARARVARGSRIWVEGRHDAELVEKVWGEDMRIEGVVVEPLHGVDDLTSAVAEFGPGPGRRLGILVDHLVEGSKEWHTAAQVLRHQRIRDHVLVVGHPFVDVWQAIKPDRVGLAEWPVIARGTDWKRGILTHLGWPARTQVDVASGWQRLLGSVRSYADLEPTMSGRVEELIDFVTAPES
ncbi:MAG: hypothetical protein CSA58_00380 [Micrococcales bacterium]|nr:MAG: hypothetical protein CSA58_00380 [Micrococcales bacterium]